MAGLTGGGSDQSGTIDRDKFILVLSHMSDPVMLIDREMRITLSNEAARRTFGYSESGRCFESIGGSPSVCTDCPVARAFDDGSPHKTEKSIILKDGSVRYLEMAVTPLADDGGTIRECIVVARDLTAMKEMERDRRDTLSMLCHDLRTPLTVINFSTEHLLDELKEMDPGKLVILERIRTASENCARLLDDFVTLTRFESGNIEMRPARIHLSMIVNYTLGSVTHLTESMDATIHKDIPDNLPEVYADTSGMSRAITNVLANAIKHGNVGGNVWIRAGVEPAGRKSVFLEVADDGPGISRESLPHIFDKYYRPRDSRKSDGSGLGLAIVKKIVELHGGSVALTSSEGTGTTVRMVLPVTPSIH